jgi:hypothetical protein
MQNVACFYNERQSSQSIVSVMPIAKISVRIDMNLGLAEYEAKLITTAP